MIIGGILLKGNGIRVVTLSGTRSSHKRLLPNFNKLDLPAKPTQQDVATFVQAFKAYCSDNSIDLLCLNQRNSGNGKHAGGSSSFRNEGIILSVSPVPVQLTSPATVAAVLRRHSINPSIRPTTVDLGKAYDFAFAALK